LKILLDTNAFVALRRGHANVAEEVRGAERIVILLGYTQLMVRREPVIESMDDEMAEILRHTTPAERLAIADGMLRSARTMLFAMLTRQHPGWSPERVAAEVAKRISHGAC
jgi:hypothetical protein